jgi:glyoxylate reductase
MKIVVTRKIPGNSLSRLSEGGNEVVISDLDRALTPEELIEKSAGADALLSLLTDKIDGEVLDAIGPQLKIVSNYAVGFDNIKVPDATERGIVVTNTPSDEVNEAVAEHTWALILSLTRRVVEADEATRRGAYKGWEPDIFLGMSLAGKTLGIVGMGRIGTMVARRAGGFNMKVLYTKRSPDPEAEKNFGVQFASLDDLLSQSDVVSMHVPLTDETRHMINKDTLAKMKKGAFIVNTARGPVIDEHDLVSALRDGHIAGAALDVFDNEPNIHPELIGMSQVVTTPHIASATWEAREKMGSQAVDSILGLFVGNKPDTIVNPEVWEKRRV